MDEFDKRNSASAANSQQLINVCGKEITLEEDRAISLRIDQYKLEINRRVLNSGEKSSLHGKGDLEALLTSVFNEDLENVVRRVVRATYGPERVETETQYWLDHLDQRFEHVLKFAAVHDNDFLNRLDQQINQFSRLTLVPVPEEDRLKITEALYRVQKLDELFERYPKDPSEAIKFAYVRTSKFGIVTICQWNTTNHPENTKYSIGINTQRASGPCIGFTLDELGSPGALSLESATGRLAVLRDSTNIPTSRDLYEGLMQDLLSNRRVVSFEEPASLNYKHILK